MLTVGEVDRACFVYQSLLEVLVNSTFMLDDASVGE